MMDVEFCLEHSNTVSDLVIWKMNWQMEPLKYPSERKETNSAHRELTAVLLIHCLDPGLYKFSCKEEFNKAIQQGIQKDIYILDTP